ncbi:hypothetical protein VC34_08190 [Pseudomonas fluorescens]|uniref:Uncharacterized protein n=1 Tax=Pseudomonas fluorescens TaxID=294 RepID=A0A0F4TPU0_PSEFL|nr:hypothetical protein VC34_08190 [Pseudomonas fluorescens]
MAQISLTRSGAFCPTSLPLFQGRRLYVAIVFMVVSSTLVEDKGISQSAPLSLFDPKRLLVKDWVRPIVLKKSTRPSEQCAEP